MKNNIKAEGCTLQRKISKVENKGDGKYYFQSLIEGKMLILLMLGGEGRT